MDNVIDPVMYIGPLLILLYVQYIQPIIDAVSNDKPDKAATKVLLNSMRQAINWELS